MHIIIMELKLHCKENVPCQYWYKQNLHCLRQELSAPWHYHHRWRHQKSVCLCVSNHINPLLNGTWLLVMPFSPTNATCRCFSYWFLTFLLSTRWCSSAALLLTRSGLSSLMHAHLVIGCSCWLAISSPLPTTLRNAVRSLTISIVPRILCSGRPHSTAATCNNLQSATRAWESLSWFSQWDMPKM